ncbi:hypothetical protein MY4824_009629 [Beauveria thailandica]
MPLRRRSAKDTLRDAAFYRDDGSNQARLSKLLDAISEGL